ncbi:ATP-binding protein [Variovorax sp. EL159]|uniref:ATP-binding protein n=1 Tax=Variovorax sp. EL159 TaxID=1566270 RepID=UPI000880AF0A|nr:ATP-binding protein [Variovorax sp. EL159]SCX40279.1 Signal transduction histidine kinase [Variovorax sp. EL159]
MKSLRTRLLIALMTSILLFWSGWGLVMSWTMWRDRVGFVDRTLSVSANLVLLSMPPNIELLLAAPPVKRTVATPPSFESEVGVAFQVWVRGRNVMRSPDAAETPMRADFTDGYSREQIGGESFRVFAVSDPARHIHVQVSRPLTRWQSDLWNAVQFALLNTAVMLTLLGATIWWVIRWSFRPVIAVHDAVQAKKALDFSPLPLQGLPVEMRPLIESFNRLLERLHRAVEGERRFIADAAHELRTPLAALAAQAHVAQRAGSIAEKNESLMQLAAGVDRTARLSEQLLALARLDAATDTERHVPLELSRLVEIVVRDFESLAARKGVQLSLIVEPCTVWGDTDEMGILLRNLVDNALRFTCDGGRIVISCRRTNAKGVRGVCLRVADDGPGIPASEHARIFERFYRVPGAGQSGSGIGLSLVARIAQTHDARIELGQGLRGRGFAISVCFPEWLDPADALVRS